MTKEQLIGEHNASIFYQKHKILIWLGALAFVVLASINY